MRTFYDEEIKDYVCVADKELIYVCVAEAKPDYTLNLTFSNGERRLYDAKPLLEYALFAPLRDLSFFMRAHCDGGTVVWNEELDIAPESLYEKSVAI